MEEIHLMFGEYENKVAEDAASRVYSVKSGRSPSCEENRQTEHSALDFTQAQGRHHKKAMKIPCSMMRCKKENAMMPRWAGIRSSITQFPYPLSQSCRLETTTKKIQRRACRTPKELVVKRKCKQK